MVTITRTPIAATSEERMYVYTPKQGYEWNPARGLPRNEPCPCGSGVKFKKCHRNLISETLPTREHQARMKAEHEARMKAEADAAQAEQPALGTSPSDTSVPPPKDNNSKDIVSP